jgi:IS30 family transposase
MNTKHVFKRIEENYGLSRAHLTCASRKYIYVEMRQFFASFMREESDMTLKQIGRALGRDHSTIINLLKKYNDRMDTEYNYANRYADFVYYMKRSKEDTKHDKAIKVLELLESKPTIGGRLNVIKNLMTDGTKVV